VHALVAVVHEGGDADGGINACDEPRGPIFDIERELDPQSTSCCQRAHPPRLHLPHRWTARDAGGSFGRWCR
jgi:hypothetical protein